MGITKASFSRFGVYFSTLADKGRKMVPQSIIKERFTYEAHGVLVRNYSAGGSSKGTEIGNLDGRYIRARVQGKKYLLHRLIWVYHNGGITEGYTIDHIDGNRMNNTIENLRCVSIESNMRNTKKNKKNKSGQMGVSWYPRYEKWVARIGIGNGKRKTIGYFDSKEEAILKRQEAEATYNYHENHGR